MIPKTNKPPLGSIRSPVDSIRPPVDFSLGNFESEHEKFAVNARCSPRQILGDHTEDHILHLLGALFSPRVPPDSGIRPPIQTKTSSTPADYCFGRDDNAGLLPTGPDVTSNYPEESVEGAKARQWMAPFELDRLLAKCQVFEKEVSNGTRAANWRA